MPSVSVIIPTFNHAKYLAEAIESVLGQTHSADQLIVVDDGSTDDTARVAAEFGSQIQYIYQPNAGLSAARNTGIKLAAGQYIGFLDADDLWGPEFLATLVTQLEGHPEWGAVYCGTRFVDTVARPLSQVITKTWAPDRLYDVLIDGEFFPPCAVLVRKSALDIVGLFDESLRACEDWDLWLRMSRAFPFGGITLVLASYRMHGNNMSRNPERIHESQIQVLRKHFGSDEGDPQSWTPERRRAFAGICLWQCLAYYQRLDNDTALEFLRQAFTATPDLATGLDTYYMLACGDQSPGYVGDVETLKLEQNTTNMFAALDSIFSEPTIPARLHANRRIAYAMAHFAVGILAYRKRSLGRARTALAKAVLGHSALCLNAQWRATFLKALMGNRLLNTLLAWKQAYSHTPHPESLESLQPASYP